MTGWALMGAGVALGALDQVFAILAALLIVVGFALSRLWRWRTDLVDYRAAYDRSHVEATAWARWGEIVAGGLLGAGLGAVALGWDWVAGAVGIVFAAWMAAVLVLDKPTE